MKDQYNKWVFRITIGLVIFLFATAFILSYEALRDLAHNNGIQGWRAYLWPLGLDAFMAVASLYMLWAYINKQWEPLPLALVMVAMGASVIFNITHAPLSNLARSVAALPPLVAFMAFEVFIIMLRYKVETSDDSEGDSETEQLACDICGATTNKKGEPFLSQTAIAGHKRWVHQDGRELVKE